MTLTSLPSLRHPAKHLAWLAASLVFTAMLMIQQAQAQQAVTSASTPNAFIQAVGDQALTAVQNDEAAKRGDMRRINQLVDQYLLPYVNFDKTTRLAVGPHWRKATDQQKQDLIDGFKGTLLRTYSSALSDADKITAMKTLPFRGDENAADVVVRSTFLQRNGPAVSVDYRLEKVSNGWKIYDLNVEGIWLIQTYRTQFSQQINQNGIDGLISALNQKNR